MSRPFNSIEQCIVCRRRASGLAVGKPEKLGWFCEGCGIPLAKEVTSMKEKEYDVIEKRAIQRVADKIGEDLVCPKAELPQFIEWLISDFGEAIKQEVSGDSPPF